MTIRARFIAASAAIIVLDIVLVALTVLILRGQADLVRAQDVATRSLELSQELRQSSDDLTRLARTYVVTGDPSYEEEYWHVLAVRNGEAPRPDGTTVPLRDLMTEIGFTVAELAKLEEAEANSNGLVATETAAFQALLGKFTEEPGGTSVDLADYTRTGPPDPEFAIRIMHDPAYHAAKALIMAPIAESETMVVARTHAAVTAIVEWNRVLVAAAIVMALLLVGAVVATYLAAQRPVLRAIEAVRRELTDLTSGSGDLSRRLTVTRRDEIGGVAAALNGLLERLGGLVGRVQGSAGSVAGSSASLTSASQKLEGMLSEQSAATMEVVAAAREISATTETLLATTVEISRLTKDAADSASSGRDDLERMRETMERMDAASEALARQLSAINERAAHITGVVTTITRVSDQTNVLSLNAAIEAVKAGSAGSGFAVVAREIRRLADQTGTAAAGIGEMVDEMQSSVATGVMGMGKFTAEVRNAVTELREIAASYSAIITEVQELGPRMEGMRDAMEGQATGARQIADAMLQLGDASARSTEAQRENARAIGTLMEAANDLRDEVSSFGTTSARG